MSDLTKPRTNDELFLAAISGDYSGELPAPTTRVQEYLAKIYKNGMGGGGGSGADGFSPVANVTQTENGATISITDKTGTTTAVIQNGKDGENGDAGADGFSPTVTVEQTETGAKITATDKNGTTSAEIKNGKDGTGSGSTDLTEVEASISALQTAVAALQETAHTHENKEFLDGLQVYLNKTFSTVTAGYEEADKALAERVTTLETSLGDIQTALENIVEVSE